jgi:hypothetical protein
VNLRILSSARGRLCLASALCVLVALVAAAGNAQGISLLPPSLKSQNLEIAGASTQAIVDLPRSTVLQRGIQLGPLDDLTARTVLLGELISTPPVLMQIAKQVGIAPGELSASTSYVAGMVEQMLWPDLQVRATQIIDARAPYQLNIQPDPALPRFEIYARAPTPQEAERLANAVVPGVRGFLRSYAISRGADPANQLRIEQLGSARGAVINSHAKVYIAGLTFLIVFALCAALLALAARVRRGWKLAARSRHSREVLCEPDSIADANGAPPDGLSRGGTVPSVAPSPSGLIAGLAGRRRPRVVSHSRQNLSVPETLRFWTNRRAIAGDVAGRRVVADIVDDWPHTTRVLPWMIAAFLFVLWLVPFDSIQLGGGSFPIDLKFDRIVLPFIFATWVLAVAAGGRGSPRLRLSWVHGGVFIFAGFACLSSVINAHGLNQTLLLDQGVKRIAQLLAYVTFFMLISSVVRRSEVPAFLRYTLVLGAVAAIGTIIEYRFNYNVFYDLSQRLLPGFQVGQAGSVGVDEIGRRLVRGPAELPLEAVGMLTMALPIALVGITDAVRRGQRILYGLVAALLLAGAIATERKSALLAPVAVILTVAYLKRRQLARFAPLALVIVGAVKVLAPGAIGSTVTQLNPSQLGVDTVTDRVLRYDAIRPDVWLHLAFGQGFGTYTVRVLDNEFLGRLIEGGVLGLSAYVLMILSVLFVAIGAIRRRQPVASTIGQIAASVAVATLVLSGTYDVLAFPHVPYIFLSLAGLLVAGVQSPKPVNSPRLRQPPRAKSRAALERAWSS